MDSLFLPLEKEDFVELNVLNSRLHKSSFTPPYDGSEMLSSEAPAANALFDDIQDLSSDDEGLIKTIRTEDAEECGIYVDPKTGDLPLATEGKKNKKSNKIKESKKSKQKKVKPESEKSKSHDKKDVSDENNNREMNETEEIKSTRKTSAQFARETRIRKKIYVKNLEDTTETLRAENKVLKEENATLQIEHEKLTNSLLYYKSILENQSELAKILFAVTSMPKMIIKPKVRCVPSLKKRITTNAPQSPRKRPIDAVDSTDDCDISSKKMNVSPGICVHVQSGEISLEMCAECNSPRIN